VRHWTIPPPSSALNAAAVTIHQASMQQLLVANLFGSLALAK
jgi:hypothetical protein